MKSSPVLRTSGASPAWQETHEERIPRRGSIGSPCHQYIICIRISFSRVATQEEVPRIFSSVTSCLVPVPVDPLPPPTFFEGSTTYVALQTSLEGEIVLHVMHVSPAFFPELRPHCQPCLFLESLFAGASPDYLLELMSSLLTCFMSPRKMPHPSVPSFEFCLSPSLYLPAAVVCTVFMPWGWGSMAST